MQNFVWCMLLLKGLHIYIDIYIGYGSFDNYYYCDNFDN